MNTARTLAAGVTGATLLLTSFPAAAMNVNIGADVSAAAKNKTAVETSVKTDAKADYKEAKASAHTDFKAKLDAAKSAFKDAKADTKVKTDVSVDANANVSTSVLVKVRNQVTSVLKRAVHRVAMISKNICNREPNETAVKACMDKAKTDFKASINAMIDASFGA